MSTVNLFFACDDNYIPFLAVTIASIKENRDPSRGYALRILHTGLQAQNMIRLTDSFDSERFRIEFINISQTVEEFSSKLHTRDYYSKSTYYRLFIPELFPALTKALYLDCDIVVLGDIARLYDVELDSNLAGAVPDSMVTAIDPFRQYVQKRLGIKAENYFNAGVLLMNLGEMRRCRFSEIFLKLLQKVTFRVAQDQDYLNVICKDRVRYVGYEWNTMPGCLRTDTPNLLHFNLDSKPWQRDDVAYSDVFWDYAERSGFLAEILGIRGGFTQAHIDRAAAQTVNLIAMGQRQARQRTQNMLIHWKIRRVVNL